MMNLKEQALVVAYVIQSDLTPRGECTMDTGVPKVWPELPPKLDTQLLVANEDPNWVEETALPRRHAPLRLSRMFYERKGSAAPGMQNRWLRLQDGFGRWTAESIPYAADLPGPEVLNHLYEKFWFATLAMSLEFKKPFPEDGIEWLLARTTISTIREGKLDFNSIISDEQGDVVVISTQVMAALDIGRRTAFKKSTL